MRAPAIQAPADAASDWYALSAHGCFSLAHFRVNRYAVISAFSRVARVEEPALRNLS